MLEYAVTKNKYGFFIFSSRGFFSLWLFFIDRTVSDFSVTNVSWSFPGDISDFVDTLPILCVFASFLYRCFYRYNFYYLNFFCFLLLSKLSSPLRIQTRANFREPALGSSGLSRLFFFHSCSRMNYFSATISFFRLLICYPTVVWSRRSCSSICGVWYCCCLQLRVPRGGQLLGLLLECWYFVVLEYGGNFIRCHLCPVFNSERIFTTVWFIFQPTICCWKSYFFNHLFFATLLKSHFRMGVLL